MRHALSAAVAVLVALATPPAARAEAAPQADEAAQAFESLYGQDVKRVAATRETADDLALAKKLIDAAKEAATHTGLVVVLCSNAYDLAMKDPGGADTAAQAMELAAGKDPDRACQYIDRVVAVRQRQYDATSAGSMRTAAGHQLISTLMRLADAQADAGDFDAAGQTLKRATAVAEALASPMRSAVQERLERLAAQRDVADRVKKLKAALEADPANAQARGDLVRLYVVDLDNPTEAAKHLGEGVDPKFAKYVPAATKPVRGAPELACLELGEWYRTLAEGAGAHAKKPLLERSQAYYERFLDLHQAEDLQRSQAMLALNKVNEALDKASPAAAAAPAGRKIPVGEWVDLVALADPQQDCLERGALTFWQKRGSTLLGQPSQHGRTQIALPVTVNGSYDLQVKFARSQLLYGSVYVYLPVGASNVSLMLTGGTSGLNYVNDRSAYYNGTGQHTTFVINRVYTVDVRVAPEGEDATIAVNLDGKPLVRWKGRQTDLSSPYVTARTRDRVGLAVYDTVTTFGLARLRMISGTATTVRP